MDDTGEDATMKLTGTTIMSVGQEKQANAEKRSPGPSLSRSQENGGFARSEEIWHDLARFGVDLSISQIPFP